MHPHDADAFTPADLVWLRELAAHPRWSPWASAAWTTTATTPAPEAQRRAFSAQIGLAREAGLPLVVHTRDAADETLDMLGREADGHPVVLHCFSMPERLDEVVERGYLLSFAGQVTYPKSTDLQRRRARGAGRSPAGGDRQPLPRARSRAGAARTDPPTWPTRCGSSPPARRHARQALDALTTRNAARAFAW